MATLSSGRLLQLLEAALPGAMTEPSPNEPKPVVLNVPNVGRVRIYLWTTTPDESAQGRPEGEHKSQIIIPGTPRGSRQHLELDIPTFLMGYSPFFGVFAVWQAELHQDAAYSKNLQVRLELLEDANRSGWAIAQPRPTRLGQEVRAAIHPSHLARYLARSIQADVENREGEDRTAFLMAYAPGLDAVDLRERLARHQPVSLEEVERARVQATGTRLKREVGFSKRVLNSYGHRCAVCGVQLSILEGAHIVPVHDPLGRDELWNGLSLCRNHHTLFDRRIILIDENAFVRANEETLRVLRELNRFDGFEELIGAYRDNALRHLPRGYHADNAFRDRMGMALRHTFSQSPAR